MTGILTFSPDELVLEKSEGFKGHITFKETAGHSLFVQLNSDTFSVKPPKDRNFFLGPRRVKPYEFEYHVSVSNSFITNFFIEFRYYIVVDNTAGKPHDLKVPVRLIEPVDLLKCQICNKAYGEELVAVVLTRCGHTICDECARRLLKEHPDVGVECPLDNKVTPATDIHLPTRTNAPRCVNDATHIAQVYCENCSANFCQTCSDDAHKPNFFSFHRRVALSEKPPIQLPKCQQHPSNVAAFLCTDPNCNIDVKIMCHSCMTSIHKDHFYVVLMKKLEENEQLADTMIRNLAEKKYMIEEKMMMADVVFQSLEQEGEEVQRRLQEIEKYFDDLKKLSLDHFNTFLRNERDKMTRGKKKFLTDLRTTQSTKEEFERLIKVKTNLFSIDAVLEKGTRVVEEPVEIEMCRHIGRIQLNWENGTELVIRSEREDNGEAQL